MHQSGKWFIPIGNKAKKRDPTVHFVAIGKRAVHNERKEHNGLSNELRGQ